MDNSLNELWNTWEIRFLVMSSLFLQIFLLALAGHRRRVVPIRMSQNTLFSWRAPLSIVLHWLLWLSYLSADFVATAALGYLSQYEVGSNGTTEQKQTKHLLMFWAPFLLLHLGGQDTITALSIEDNELWMRHLLTLISQVVFAIYVYGKSNPREGGLWPAAIPMFIAGFVKYAERTWSLQRASMSGMLSSVINVPDPNPIHAKLMEEFTANVAAGLPSQIIVIGGGQKDFMADQKKQKKGDTNWNVEDNMRRDERYSMIISQAYRFFQMFKGLFVDLILSLENWEESKKFFKELKSEEAYKVIEIELLLMYEMLHSKAELLHTWYGCVFRAVTLVCTLTALCIFTVHSKSGFGQTEMVLTYLLLGGAVVLELVSVFSMFVSIWTFAALNINSASGQKLKKALFSFVKRKWPIKRSLWSNQMGQYNLIDFAAKDKSCLWSKIMKSIYLKDKWDNYRYTTYVPVEKNLRDLVLDELKSKMKMALNDHRGRWILLREGYYNKLGWSVDSEFEKSILIWHVATDLLFKTDDCKDQKSNIGQYISNYMLFLLIMRPFMLPAGIGKIRFEGTCAEARNFFMRRIGTINASPQEMILRINTDYDPKNTRDNGSMSVLFDGCKLAHQLKELFFSFDKKDGGQLKELLGQNSNAMWELINTVWVEILCFAANKCSGQFHAKQMSKGGELLTIVWMLMAHLGLGDQCKVEVNPIVKLVIEK